jgi:hypothetical protein
MAGDKLEKLIAQRKALEARIRQEQNRENDRKRKQDTRRKILAGAVVLDEAAGKPEYRAELYKLLGRFLSRAEDRALFGLEPLPKVEEDARKPEGNAGEN